MCIMDPELWAESTDLLRAVNIGQFIASSVFFSFALLGESKMSLFCKKGSTSPGASLSQGDSHPGERTPGNSGSL